MTTRQPDMILPQAPGHVLDLQADQPAKTQELLLALGWLMPGESVLRCPCAGAGNMNLALLVETDRRRFVLKHARAWVEKYPSIPAPPERNEVERAFYQRVRGLPGVARRMPRLLNASPEQRLLMIEYLPDSSDFTDAYRGGRITQDCLRDLADYLRELHRLHTNGPNDVLTNRAMRRLNHEHLFEVPLQADNGLDLERFEPGLTRVAERLREDAFFCDTVLRLGQRYLFDGPCLLHGDFFPGSWLNSAGGRFVIDPEFCFPGDPEFDVAVALAHLALTRQPIESGELFVNVYGGRGLEPDLLAGFASVEVMRRLIGVAQLPIPASEGWRAECLQRSQAAVREGEWRCLWPS